MKQELNRIISAREKLFLIICVFVLTLGSIPVFAAEESAIDETVYLLDVGEPYKTPGRYEEPSAIDMGGKTYMHGFTCMGYEDSDLGNATYFNLDGQFSTITFITGIVEDHDGTVTFTVYADKEPVYNFTMESGDLPVEHEVTIEGCKQLVIAVNDGASVAGFGTYGIAEIKLTSETNGNNNSKNAKTHENGQYLLDEIKPYKIPGRYEEPATIDMGGKTYMHGFTCMGYEDTDLGNATYFNLDGQFSTISFTTGIVEDHDGTVTFTIYADKDPVYSYTMESGDLPVNHEVPIYGCRQLIIAVDDGAFVAGFGTYGIVDITVY